MSECLTFLPRVISGPIGSDSLTKLGLGRVVVSSPLHADSPLIGADSPLIGTDKRDKEFRAQLDAIQSYRNLEENWDRYGGQRAGEKPLEFAANLISDLQGIPEATPPLVRPIGGGVYLEWRCGNALLYFEADEDSVLQYSRNTYGETTMEDATFDAARAAQAVMDFHENAA